MKRRSRYPAVLLLTAVAFAGVSCSRSAESKPHPPKGEIVFVTGSVKRPGTFSLPPSGMTLQQLLGAAGGSAAPSGDAKVTLIHRVGDGEESSTYRLRELTATGVAGVPLQPNDTVSVVAE